MLENELPLTNVSPTETSKHLRVRHEITLLSSYLNIIKENFTKDDVSQHTQTRFTKNFGMVHNRLFYTQY